MGNNTINTGHGAAEDAPPRTQHALLVAWGHFVRTTGLLEQILTVPIAQQDRDTALQPAQKLLELLIGLLSGMEYLSDLSAGPAPLARDGVVAQAWGLGHLASASAVSRTLSACDDQSVSAVQTVLEHVSQPYLDRAVRDVRLRDQVLELDMDLTGRPVSATSHTFPGAAFGHMDGEVRLGYQVAAVCLRTALYGRQWLCGQHHPGNTVAAPCLLHLVAEAERRLGCHPWRRVDLLATRVHTHETAMAALQQRIEGHTQTLSAQRACQAQRADQLQHAQAQLRMWAETPLSARQDGRYSRFSRLQRQVAGWQARLARAQCAHTRTEGTLRDLQQRLAQMQQEHDDLVSRLAHLCYENDTQPEAPRCRVRVDAGFCSGENLTTLLELGYEVDTKSGNDALVQALRQRITPDTAWTRVGDNAEMIGWSTYQLTTCPYPVAVALERFHTGTTVRYAALIRSAATPTATLTSADLVAWFHDYNARQTIEAGNKQAKTVFHVQHLMSHAAAGMQIQVLLTLFAANLVPWAEDWLRPRLQSSAPCFEAALHSPKRLVRVAANSLATVSTAGPDVVLQFDQLSSFGGVTIRLTQPSALAQLPLPFFGSDHFGSPEAIRPLIAQ
ncbi:MAG: hypothetical protein M1546_16575 [Chloroflexi bacterium]|nr:hypothetical protein [Chloroflexota bacterium]